MATWTKRNEIIKTISLFPVFIETTPRFDMVYIKWTTQLFFGYAAILTGIFIAFTGFILLSDPIWSTPFFIATLPIGMIFTFLPFGSTSIRAKSLIFATFDYMRLNLSSFSALTTSKKSMTTFITTLCRTSQYISSRWDNLKWFSANLTQFCESFPTRKPLTFSRAKYSLGATERNKFFTTILALDWFWFDKIKVTLTRAKFRRFLFWLKFFMTVHTFYHFHTVIIPATS